MRSVYYSRNNSFSRSFNAEQAEAEGRLPRSRAAAVMGLSLAAFDAGCKAAEYYPGEWHHVGKYAKRVDYYDTEELAETPEFWTGAALTYKSTKKQAEVLARRGEAEVLQAEREVLERRERVEAFRARMIRQRNCTRKVRRHDGSVNWRRRCLAAGVAGQAIPKVGDEAGFQAAAEAARAELLARQQREAGLMSILKQYFTLGRDEYGREVWICGNVVVFRHVSGVNIAPKHGVNLTIEKATARLKSILNI